MQITDKETYMNKFSQRVSDTLTFSKEEALRLQSTFIGPEHLLLGMLRDKSGYLNSIIEQFSAETSNIKNELEEKVRQQNTGRLLVASDVILNDKANNILRLAVLEARQLHDDTVDLQHLLLAILHDNYRNGAKDVLENNSINYDTLLPMMQPSKEQVKEDGLGLQEDEDEEEADPILNGSNTNNNRNTSTTQHKAPNTQGKSKTPILDNFSTDLTLAAREGKLDPTVGRDNEIQRVFEILGRRKKNNPVLIGEPGVGKTAIVEGLAQLIVKHQTSPILYGKRVVNLNMAAIVAGTKYRGQFEERIRALIKELEQNPDIIVFIDEIHTIIGAGSTPGSMDAANILKPALARGTIQCIGATTLSEYRNSIEKDGALERRFQKVVVNPTTKEETLQILENIKSRYEDHHLVTYTDEALKACVNLADRYINDRFFPDKAIDILDESGSRTHLANTKIPDTIVEKEKEMATIKQKKQEAVDNQDFELAAQYRDRQSQLEEEFNDMKRQWEKGSDSERQTVDIDQIETVVSMMTGVPVQRMQEAETQRLKNMADKLKEAVVAQDKAIEKMVKAIQRNRVGLKDPNHPIGAFMFLGPTGVGKTYLAKKLAEQMFGSADALIRVDMSEYTESFNTSRLIGAPPGYVGYDEGGQLTEKVRRNPYSIILLDEIEKAHSNVYNLLLQVLDEGRLTDGSGRLIDFRNTVIIMTSNAGTRQLKEFGRGIGFNAGQFDGFSHDEKDKEYARSIIQKSLSKQFSPEFLNRLDEIITFDQLDLEAIKKIIDIELQGLYKRTSQLGYTLQLTDNAKEFVATKGYDVQFGARPLKRAIKNYVEDCLCELLLSDNVAKDTTIVLDKHPEDDKLVIAE